MGRDSEVAQTPEATRSYHDVSFKEVCEGLAFFLTSMIETWAVTVCSYHQDRPVAIP